MSTVPIHAVAICVTDLERSRRFYDLLGLPQLGLERVTYQVGESRLLLYATEAGQDAPALWHSRLELHFGIDKLDPFVERLAERATPVLQEPTDQPWGEREAIVPDPDGYPSLSSRCPRASAVGLRLPSRSARKLPPARGQPPGLLLWRRPAYVRPVGASRRGTNLAWSPVTAGWQLVRYQSRQGRQRQAQPRP
jgi:catechol 2,3-dioxygenase-like lactoylglutathione lyase family enzyme